MIMAVWYVGLISDIDECSENTHSCNKRKATCANSAGSFICSCKPGFTGDGHNCRGKILKSIISFTRKKKFPSCNAPKKKTSIDMAELFFIGRFLYAAKGITRSKSNVI